MNKLNKERLEEIVNDPMINQGGEFAQMARALLAAYEQEPVAWVMADDLSDDSIISTPAYPSKEDAMEKCIPGVELIPLFTRPAPSIPAVPEEMTKSLASIAKEYQTTPQNALFIVVGWNACRAAMLQAEPVIHDDTRRMDWLVSKTVNVREPLVYGSHDLFWSQTISDDWEEEHKTTLREQIDAAMLNGDKP